MIGGIFIFILIGIGGALGIWLIIYIIKRIYKVILVLLAAAVFFLVIGFVFAVFSKNVNTQNVTTTAIDTSEYQDNGDNLNEGIDEKEYIHQSIRWHSYTNKKYKFNYRIKESDYENAQQNRSTYTGATWGEIYQNLYDNDKNMLTGIYRKFDSLKTGYSAIDFARLVVSSVQEVPYTWILVDDCSTAPNYREIQNSGYKCLGNIKNYAVLSPAEFLVTHEGDCDTKSMVIYTILKHFNYDVRVLISEQYGHAMLGINIPSAGRSLNYMGTRYYVWETTVQGMDVGLITPDYSNMSFWEVAL
jgi:hypothetical protein